VVNISGGAAFGNGSHPSTHLTLKALDYTLAGERHFKVGIGLTGLDVGTGTGILAIALAMLGVERVLGLDIDPCAVSEATHNISLNEVAEQVNITNTPLEELTTHFSVIVANLSHPTLKRLSYFLSERLEEDGFVVLSGFKKPAAKLVEQAYSDRGLTLIHEETDREWGCMTLRKKPGGRR
jgi:ribosomal protein L11 methyltransferase